VFTTPLDTMLDLTDNVLKEKPILYSQGLIANNGYTVLKNTEGVEELQNATAHFTTLYELHNLEELGYVGYTRLGISADFMSWLPEARSGSYGLRITIQDKLQTTTTDEKGVEEVS
jgi:hypothetical protein